MSIYNKYSSPFYNSLYYNIINNKHITAVLYRLGYVIIVGVIGSYSIYVYCIGSNRLKDLSKIIL